MLLSDEEVFGAGTQPAGLLSDDEVFGSPPSSGWRRAGDVGLTALKGAISLPEAAVGLADLATGGHAGKWLEENAGFRPKAAKAAIDDWYSPEQKAANRAVSSAEGFWDTAGAAIANPSTILHAGIESVPLMLGGAGIARGVMAAAPGVAPWAAGAIGEGVVGAGAAAEGVRQESGDGLLSGKQAGAALASGAGAAALGAVGGKLAQRLHIDDVDTLLAGGAQQASKRGLPARMAGGAISEGVFEELPQSAQEQVWQNVALDRPLDEGVGHAAAMGMLTGGLLGAAGGGGGHLMRPSGAAVESPGSAGAGSEASAPALLPPPAALVPPTQYSNGADEAAIAELETGNAALWQAREAEAARRDAAFEVERLRGIVDYAPVSPADYLPEAEAVRPSPAAGMPGIDYFPSGFGEAVGPARPAHAGLQIPAVDPNAGPLSRAASQGIAAGVAGLLPGPAPITVSADGQAVTADQAAERALLGLTPDVERAQRLRARREVDGAPPTTTESRLNPTPATAGVVASGASDGAIPVAETHAALAAQGAQAERGDVYGGGGALASAPLGDGGHAGTGAALASSGLRSAVASGNTGERNLAPAAETIGGRVAHEIPAAHLERVAQSSLPTAEAARNELARRKAKVDDANAGIDQLPRSAGHLGFVPATPENPVVRELIARQDGRIGVADAGNAIDGETGNRFSRGVAIDAPESRARVLRDFGAVAPPSADNVTTLAPSPSTERSIPTDAPEKARQRQAPIMRRDDLVGAVMRVTGGKGIAANMAQTIIGEKANRAGGLRGLFSNQGVMDLDDTAMLLREEEGYDVRDGNHLAELLAEQAGGSPVYSMARAVREREAAEEKARRNDVHQRAAGLGVKTVARKFEQVEADVLAAEAAQREAETARLDDAARAAYHALIEEAGALGVDVGGVLDQIPDSLSLREAYQVLAGRLEPMITAKLGEINRDLQRAADDERYARQEDYDVESSGIDGEALSGGAEESDQSGGAQAGAGRDAAPAGRAEGEGRGGRDSGADGFALAAHNERDLAAKAARETDEAIAQRAAADREREAFALAGQSQANPRQVPTGGQGSLFTADGRAAQVARKQDRTPADAGVSVSDSGTFVRAPDGSVDFGEITPEMAKAMKRQAGKIRLEKGNSSYGLQHIEERHGAQIRSLGFTTVQGFVADAMQHIDAIWKPSKTSQMVVVQSVEHGKAVFIELKPSENGDYYTVNTAFPIGDPYAERKKNWALLWGGASVPSVASGANPLAEQPPNAGAAAAMTPGQSSRESVAKPAGDGNRISGSGRYKRVALESRRAGDAAPRQDDLQFAADFLNELAYEDEAFRYQVSTSKTLDGNLAHALPGVEFLGEDTRPDEREESLADHRFVFAMPRTGTIFYVYTRGNEVWIDVSRLRPGDRGSAVYHGVANYAHNTGRVFVGDPQGLSEDAVIWRTRAMLSSALRFGTTAHLGAAREQIAGVPEKGIEPLDWRGNDVAKVRALIHTFVTTLQNLHPRIKGAYYDFTDGTFRDADGERLRWDARPGGDPELGRRMESLAGDGAGGVSGAFRAGPTALRFGILIQSLMDRALEGRPGLLELVLRRAAQLARRDGGPFAGLLSRAAAAGGRGIGRGADRSPDRGLRGGERRADPAEGLGAAKARVSPRNPDTTPAPAGVSVSGARRFRVQAVETVAKRFQKAFKGADALDIRVVFSADEIPAPLRPSEFAEGVFHGDRGLIYLVTENLPETPRVWQVLMHEAVGHYGLAHMMGERFSDLLQHVMRVARDASVTEDVYGPGDRQYATVEAVRLRYPDASDTEVAQEVMARMAESGEKSLRFGSVLAAIRQWLRDAARALGVRVEVTTTELNDLIAKASGYLRAGKNLGQAIEPGGLVAASERQRGEPEWPGEFVRAPDGSIDFGEITPEMAGAMRRQSGKIRLQQGVQNSDGTGYGLAHIEANHGKQIRNAGFADATEFVSHVARNFHEILQASGRQLLVAVENGRQDVMFVQLEPSENGDFYRINTAFPASRNYLEKQQKRGMKLLWGGSEPASPVAGKQSLYAGAPENDSGQGTPIAQGQSSVETIAKPFDEDKPNPLYTVEAGEESPVPEIPAGRAGIESRRRVAGDSGRRYSAAQRQTFRAIGREVETPTVKERIAGLWQNIGKKLRQGIADQFAPLKDLGGDAYLLARMSKGADGALEAMLMYGRVFLSGGVYDVDVKDGGVIEKLLRPLGKEVDDFMWWVAGNRAAQLAREGREHLMTPADIANLKALSGGQLDFDYRLPGGATTRNRAIAYRHAQQVLADFNKSVLDVAEQSGLIDGADRRIWERDFYVPFYREAEEGDGGKFPSVKKGLVRQKAFERLKGGTDKLNHDLLANTLLNWSHLLNAAAKNRAAKASLEAAERAGVATRVPAGEKGAVFFRDKGREVHYVVEDPFVLDAVTALEFSGFSGPAMRAMGAFKRWLTIGVTASPTFKIRNLIRDSISALGQAELSYNVGANLAQGFKATDRRAQTYASMLAGGGVIRFGTMVEGNRSDHVRRLVQKGVDPATILDSDSKWKALWQKRIMPVIDAYNEIGDRAENINRAALYEQLRKKGLGHAEASMAARDLLDFSMGGTFAAVRFLTQTVPFANARIQGLYKLGRAARENPKRMGYVVGAVALASLALLAAYHDDDEWKKREDWDRDVYWWFRVGGVAYRIPKPFEIGAIGTLAERSAELLFDQEMDGKRFGTRLGKMVSDTFAMNPVPQMFKPLMDLYSNRDSFTGRAIETMGMEKMRAEDRFTGRTSEAAKLIGKTGVLSPVQVDHLIRGYFGWLGTASTTVIDQIARAGEPVARPAMTLRDVFLAGNFVETLPTNSSRYVTQMYEQSRVIEEAYNSWRHYVKLGDAEMAVKILEGERDKIGRYRLLQGVKSAEAQINARIRRIEADKAMSRDAKRVELDRLYQQKDRIARSVVGAAH